jgi:hypothetical protein
VPGSYCDAQALLADGDRGVVDGLYVDVVFREELVRCSFGEGSVANEDGDDV